MDIANADELNEDLRVADYRCCRRARCENLWRIGGDAAADAGTAASACGASMIPDETAGTVEIGITDSISACCKPFNKQVNHEYKATYSVPLPANVGAYDGDEFVDKLNVIIEDTVKTLFGSSDTTPFAAVKIVENANGEKKLKLVIKAQTDTSKVSNAVDKLRELTGKLDQQTLVPALMTALEASGDEKMVALSQEAEKFVQEVETGTDPADKEPHDPTVYDTGAGSYVVSFAVVAAVALFHF